MSKTSLFLAIIALSIIGCSKDSTEPDEVVETPISTPPPPAPTSHLNLNLTYGQVSDIDGNTYATIILGSQEWMAENLRSTKYCNGDVIFNAYSDSLWRYHSPSSEGRWRSNPLLVDSVNGNFYNYYAATDTRNICPCNWHVPSEAEWLILFKQLDPSADIVSPYTNGPQNGDISTTVGGMIKSTGFDYWLSPNSGATNSSGFSAVASNYVSNTGQMSNSKQFGLYWSTTIAANVNPVSAIYSRFLWDRSRVDGGNSFQRGYGLSIRCVKD